MKEMCVLKRNEKRGLKMCVYINANCEGRFALLKEHSYSWNLFSLVNLFAVWSVSLHSLKNLEIVKSEVINFTRNLVNIIASGEVNFVIPVNQSSSHMILVVMCQIYFVR